MGHLAHKGFSLAIGMNQADSLSSAVVWSAVALRLPLDVTMASSQKNDDSKKQIKN